MAAPRKAIFAATQTEARRIMGAFDLPGDEWFGYGYDNVLVGRQFDRIVIKLPDHMNPGLFALLEKIKSRISEEGRIDYI